MTLPTDSVVAPSEPISLPLPLGFPLRLPATARHPQPLSGTPVCVPRTGRSATMARGGPELEHIVGGTDQRPLPPDLPHPPQQELAKAASLLDLPKDRLHDGLPLGVLGTASFGPQGPAGAD